MKWKKIAGSLLTSVLCCLLAGNVLAKNRDGAFTVSPMVGGFAFEGDQDLNDRDKVSLGIGLGYNFTENWGAEGLFTYIPETERVMATGSKTDVDGLLYRLEGLYHFMPEKRLVPFLALGVGNMTLNPDDGSSENTFTTSYGAGLKYFMTEDAAMRFDVRHLIGWDQGLDEGNHTDNNLLYTLGLTFLVGGKEEPLPPRDSDGDGVVDELDRCPDTPRGVSVDRWGCPLDSDGDGVYDYLDKCPDTPRGVPVDAQGCPLDSDGDGVYDYLDKCPGTPKGVPVDAHGCPLDSDGDGVYDYLDQCPGTYKGIAVDEKGCALTFILNIEFDFDKADIRPIYHQKLKEAADFIAKHRGYEILIAGHTDDLGTEDYNQALSQRRAESVRQYLIDKFGVNPKLLTAQGFGEDRPLASNDTEAGRQKNRRVDVSCCTVAPR